MSLKPQTDKPTLLAAGDFVMSETFIPSEARPLVSQELIQLAWAVAEQLEKQALIDKAAGEEMSSV